MSSVFYYILIFCKFENEFLIKFNIFFGINTIWRVGHIFQGILEQMATDFTIDIMEYMP